MTISYSFAVVFHILIIFSSISSFASGETKNGDREMRLELTHRHYMDDVSAPKTQYDKVKDLVQDDLIRVRMLYGRISRYHYDNGKVGKHSSAIIIPTTKASNSSAVLPISSAAYKGIGQYFVQFRVGTPSKKFTLIVDTGSDLTWINCRYRCKKCTSRTRMNDHRIFQAARSLSFKTIPCSSNLCKNLTFSLVTCPSKRDPCQYDYGYQDGSTAHGFYAYETVTMSLTNGRKTRLHGVPIGCSYSTSTGTLGVVDGVLGLGYNDNSFATKATSKFGNNFSYCLVDHLSPKNVSSHLTFGYSKHLVSGSSPPTNFQFTNIQAIDGLYHVNIVGISIGGLVLKIPSEIFSFQNQGGVILDSGSSLTFLVEPAYKIVMKYLMPAFTKFKQVKDESFEFCFQSQGFHESAVPKLVFHFADSVRFEPHLKSYVIDVSDGVKCLGFMPNAWPGISIIGNIMQQNFLWEFDLKWKRLGFAPSTCT
ncbi:hypothetical protein C5167_011309 [Papaver somniferum]|uniref:Peptidase A1 domain-containing protein n=1 Tax=Papaver somniferum TaxID=3469 RepID=A0A4Y7K6I7_PAPSO|nr:aspartic proteinase NANA, chloroplast-like [Papaver somniferum]RZC67615.1 hypothetical protein C5167_011309 [Papaver somniferum]